MRQKGIYELDQFVEIVQTHIYSICRTYVEMYKNASYNTLILPKFDWIENEIFNEPINVRTFILPSNILNKN
jgi:hypothetical protein